MHCILKYGFVALLLVNNIMAKEWNGIVPLRTTRQEVESILGKPIRKTSYDDFFELKNENALVTYSRGNCRKYSFDYDIPAGTVTEICIYPKSEITLDELDLSKYVESIDIHYRILHYEDFEEGFRITAPESNRKVSFFNYSPTASDEKMTKPCS
jgi:hypothetical protein